MVATHSSMETLNAIAEGLIKEHGGSIMVSFFPEEIEGPAIWVVSGVYGDPELSSIPGVTAQGYTMAEALEKFLNSIGWYNNEFASSISRHGDHRTALGSEDLGSGDDSPGEPRI